MTDRKRMVVGISGASGAIYGVRLLEALHQLDFETHLVISDSAYRTIEYETPYSRQQVLDLADYVYDTSDIGATISSGSFKTLGMIVAPCSIRTLSAIANSYNENLIVRAADVSLKERRRLVLIVRETPLHIGHLRLMAAVSEAGGVILPPVPAFYTLPKTLDDIVNHSIGKALDLFDIEADLFRRWAGEVKPEDE